jgi:hypothetical protein
MKFRAIIIIISTLLLFNPVYAKWGSGQLKLSNYAIENVISYMYGAGGESQSGDKKKRNTPLIMAISIDGNYTMSFYCPAQYNNNCMETGIAHDVIINCEKYSEGSPCFVFAKKRRIVWKNGGPKVSIKKKELKSPYVIAKKIQDAGFYDGVLSELTGFDIETGQINEDITITGEKKNTGNSSDKKSANIVDELEALTKLYENGSLSKKEFEKAKKKLFNE